MKGVSFVTDETKKRRYAQIDLKGIASFDDEALEDLMDIIISEARKGEKSIPWETVLSAVVRKIDSLALNPRPEGCKKLVDDKEDSGAYALATIGFYML